MISVKNIENKVNETIAEMFGAEAESLSGETLLVQDLNIKSANRINLSVQLEEIFDVEINLFEILKLQTLQEVYDLVRDKLAE
jgi:acyl carrier protein